MGKMKQEKQKRSWLTRKRFFRLLKLACVTLLVFAVYWIYTFKQRDKALDRIATLGGHIQSPTLPLRSRVPTKVDTFIRTHVKPSFDKLLGPAWMRRFESTYSVNIYGTISDDDLKLISNLRTLQSIEFENGNNITSDGFRYLSRMPDLRFIRTYQLNSYVCDTYPLKDLKKLEHIYLGGCEFNDQKISELSSLKHLRRLMLNSTHTTTGVGFQNFKSANHLTFLAIDGTGITDEGLKHIAKFTELTTLSLPKSEAITHQGIKQLSSLKQLTYLRFHHPVSDEDMKTIAQFKKLNTLFLESSELITMKGIHELKGLPINSFKYQDSESINEAEVRKIFPRAYVFKN